MGRHLQPGPDGPQVHRRMSSPQSPQLHSVAQLVASPVTLNEHLRCAISTTEHAAAIFFVQVCQSFFKYFGRAIIACPQFVALTYTSENGQHFMAMVLRSNILYPPPIPPLGR